MGQMSGGEAMARALLANGVDTVFGIPGAQMYPLFDAFYRLPEFNTIVPRHEQGAAYMAFGYTKVTGKPSAFAVVPGPGILNTAAAVCTIEGCCQPVIGLTGEAFSDFIGKGRGILHELRDQRGTMASIAKDALHIHDATQTGSIMNEAFRVMNSDRPGPVIAQMAWDTMQKEWDIEIGAGNAEVHKPEINSDEIRAAAKLITEAEKPMIMLGAGAMHAGDEVKRLAELLDAPVTAFRSGRGIVAEDSELGISSVAARELWDDTDLIIGIGSRMEMQYFRWSPYPNYKPKPTYGPKIVRIEIDQNQLDSLVADAPVLADSADGTNALFEELVELGAKSNPARRERITAAKTKARGLIEKVQPQVGYWDTIRNVMPRDGVIVPEVSQMGFTSYFGLEVLEPRTYITEGFQGTLGFGFQTAVGAKVGAGDRPTISVTGDGGFMFGVQELATAVKYNIGLVTLIFNNSAFGNVRRDQQNWYKGNLIGADLKNPDFVKMAESFGAAGYRVDSPKSLQPVLEQALADNKPCLIDVQMETGSETSPWEFIMMANKSWD